MDWVYAAIIVGCLAYAGTIIIDYVNRRTVVSPRIRQLEDGAVEVGLEFSAEEDAMEQIRMRASTLETQVNEQRLHRTAVKGGLVSERERKRRLEIAVFRKRLKSKEPLRLA